MKSIKTNIFLLAMMAAAPLAAVAQTAEGADAADSTVVKKKVHVASPMLTWKNWRRRTILKVVWKT